MTIHIVRAGGLEGFQQPVNSMELNGLMIDNRVLTRPPSAPSVQMQGFLDGHIKSMKANLPDNIVEQVGSVKPGIQAMDGNVTIDVAADGSNQVEGSGH